MAGGLCPDGTRSGSTLRRHHLVILATVNETSVAFITLGVLVGLMLLILYLFLR